MAAAHSGAPSAAPAGIAAPLAKAEGQDGKTIAEIWAQKASLADQTVAVRGQVVKYNGGILGKNWLHIQDGSGSPATGDFDLAVTTDAPSAVGQVVVVRGVVHLDRDFGMGYAYPVMIEEAKIEK
jgi:hypothetical protein